jgi:hypothetical protein
MTLFAGFMSKIELAVNHTAGNTSSTGWLDGEIF